MPVSFMLTPLHSIIDRKEDENYLFLPLYGNKEDSLMTVHSSTIDELQWGKKQSCFVFSVV